jgi:HEAT repeat protein
LAQQPRQGAEQLVTQLANPDERIRAETALQLGRLKSTQGVDPLAATLAGDRSPAVREAAARALALIASPQALPALEKAAATDPDHDVRHSARFAIDVINSGR